MADIRKEYFEKLGVSRAVLDQLDFDAKARAENIPIYGKIQLTNRCNLRCCHCYIHNNDSLKEAPREVSGERLASLIEEIAAAGCLYLTLTGGEPLLRSDFSALYIKAKEQGMLVSIFTNGTLLNEDHVKLFSEYRPHYVEITLYGASRQVYEEITGIPGSYDRCMKGIQALLDAGIHLRIKTIVMTKNSHELDAMEQLVEQLGVPFRSSSDMMPTCSGDDAPIAYRIPPEEAIDVELRSADARKFWFNLAERGKHLTRGKLFHCRVGQHSFIINAEGLLQPCERLRDPALTPSLLTCSFEDAWQLSSAMIASLPMPENSPCTDCQFKKFCLYCPAAAYLEHGRYDIPSTNYCQKAKIRYSRLIGRQVGGESA